MGKGGIDPNTAVQVEGISYNDGVFSVDVSVLDADTPYAWIKVNPNDVTEDEVDSWHWGLFEDASSTTDLWDGIFHGDTLAQCGNAIGLDTTDLVDGRVLKMWAEKDNEVAYEVSAELDVSGTPTPSKVLTGLSVSGSFDESKQITGSAPDLSGLTFTASYNDGTDASVSASSIVVSPSVWDASGNPANLESQTATFSYTEGEVTETDTLESVIHRPADPTFDITERNVVYFDYVQDLLDEQISKGLKGPNNLLNPSAPKPMTGELFMAVFIGEDTTVDGAKLQEYYVKYRPNMMSASSGTPNTAGFFPQYGVTASSSALASGEVDDACFVAASFEGKPEPSDPYYSMWAGPGTYEFTIVVGTLLNDLTTSYSYSDIDENDRFVYHATYTITE